MHIKSFYDSQTSTFTHVVVDSASKRCAIIDPVLNYDQDAARVTTESADQVIMYITQNNLINQWILETHIHADHITAAHYLQKHVGGKTGIGAGIKDVLPTRVPIVDTGADTPIDGSQFDHIFAEGEQFKIGQLDSTVMLTPGHTPACSTYCINKTAFIGDTLFHPDSGTARVDFPGGSAEDLYLSIQRIYQLPDDTTIYLCHDYPVDRAAISSVPITEQKSSNIMLNAKTTLAEFVAKRKSRDQELGVPKLILPSIQTNMRLGKFSQPEHNGIQYIRIPINQL